MDTRGADHKGAMGCSPTRRLPRLRHRPSLGLPLGLQLGVVLSLSLFPACLPWVAGARLSLANAPKTFWKTRLARCRMFVPINTKRGGNRRAKKENTMETTTENQAEAAFAFINLSLAQGKNVYVGTQLRAFQISPRLAAKWDAAGTPLFRLKDGNLLMRSGRNSVKLAIPELRLVSITSSFH